MRILITVDPEIPVPPEHYGGIERNVDYLQKGFVDAGHEVVLLAHRDSKTKGILLPWPALRSQHPLDLVRNTFHLSECYHRYGPFDVVKSVARMAYLIPILGDSTPKIQCYHRFVSHRSVKLGTALAGKSLSFGAISHFIANGGRVANERWEVVYNAISIENFEFNPKVSLDAPLVFLGRLDRVKGAHHAIAIARRTGRKLILAGNISELPHEKTYFESEVAPYIDGKQIQFIGPVNEAQKSKLLGEAAALIFPIEWDEPFGMVLIEACACGTPVIAVNRGGVPEIIEHGVTGWLATKPEELDVYVSRINEIDRGVCRRMVEKRFSSQVAVANYLRVLEDLTK
jgi:glycosyltransferase involved in cell wall biosynthesis